MLLAVDVGNTSIHFGLFDAEPRVTTFRLPTVPEQAPASLAAALREKLAGVPMGAIERCLVASVVPRLEASLRGALAEVTAAPVQLLGSDVNVDIDNRCDQPGEVGMDRLVNAVAAHALVPGGAIVVDLGTATKLDCISPDGAFLGGIIAPGLELCMQALASRAAKLRAVELAAPPSPLGRNTTHAVQAGVVLGHAEMIDGLVRRLRNELPFDVTVLATGGYAERVVPQCRTSMQLTPELTLIGIKELGGRVPV